MTEGSAVNAFEPPGRCFACDVNAGREPAPGGTIYEDALWIADHGVSRLVAGYVVLKPKRHVHELADLEPGEAVTLGPALRTVLAAMRGGPSAGAHLRVLVRRDSASPPLPPHPPLCRYAGAGARSHARSLQREPIRVQRGGGRAAAAAIRAQLAGGER